MPKTRTSSVVIKGNTYNVKGNNYIITILNKGVRKLLDFDKVSNQDFCKAWCDHYQSGIEAVASAVGLSVRWTWIRFCLLHVQGVQLPRLAAEHRIFDLPGMEVQALNRAIRTWLRSS